MYANSFLNFFFPSDVNHVWIYRLFNFLQNKKLKNWNISGYDIAIEIGSPFVWFLISWVNSSFPMFVSIFLILVHYFRHGIFIQSIFFVMTEFPKQMFLILENFGVDITFFFFFLLRTTKPSIYMPWPKKYTPVSEITIKSLPHPKLWSYWGLPFSRGEGSQESIDIQPPPFFFRASVMLWL